MKVASVAVLLLVGLVAAGVCLLRGNEAPAAIEPGSPPSVTTAPPSVARDVRPDAPSVRTDAIPIDSSPKSSPTLHGTFVVVDDGGVEHAGEDGSLRLRCLSEETRGPIVTDTYDVDVIGGRWQTPVERVPDSLTVVEATLGGRLVTSPARVVIEHAAAGIDLRGAWLSTMQLRVLGEDSGLDLAGVRIVTVHEWSSLLRPYPGNVQSLEVLVDDARSPVRFEPTVSSTTQNVWVCADGYAWQRLELATRDASERVVRLTPGGGVDVSIVGGELPDDALLRVRTSFSNAPAAEFAFRRDTITHIDHLAVGDWQLHVEKGPWYPTPVSFGSTPVHITAGTTTSVTIVLQDDLTPPRSVHAAGTLSIAAEWGNTITLGIEARGSTRVWQAEVRRLPLAAMPPIGNGVFRWDAGMLPIGDYRASVIGAAFQLDFSLGAAGDENISVVVPEPCRVHVRCVDADNGRQIPPGRWALSWYASNTETGTCLQWDCARELGDGTFVFEAPPTEIVLHAHPPDYQWGHQVVPIVPGSNEVVMQIRQDCGIEIVLLDDRTGATLPFLAAVALTMANGDSAISYVTTSRVATRVAGEFLLSLGDVAGYERVPARKVTVTPGRWTHVEIRLTKAQ